MDITKLWQHTQLDLKILSSLLNAMVGALKPEKCFWYTLDYVCTDGEWTYANMTNHTLVFMNPDGNKSLIIQEEVNVSKKRLGVHASLSGCNMRHLKFIQNKAITWINRR
jgi:hypothetical protein